MWRASHFRGEKKQRSPLLLSKWLKWKQQRSFFKLMTEIESQRSQEMKKYWISFIYFHHLSSHLCVFLPVLWSLLSQLCSFPFVPLYFSFLPSSHCLLHSASWTCSSTLGNMKHTGGFDVYLSSEFQVQSNISEIRWQSGSYYIGMH